MKKILLTILLVGPLILLGERYSPHHLAGFNWRDGKTIYQKVYVIGDSNCNELFEIPTQDKTEWMTPEAVEKYNKSVELKSYCSGVMIEIPVHQKYQ